MDRLGSLHIYIYIIFKFGYWQGRVMAPGKGPSMLHSYVPSSEHFWQQPQQICFCTGVCRISFCNHPSLLRDRPSSHGCSRQFANRRIPFQISRKRSGSCGYFMEASSASQTNQHPGWYARFLRARKTSVGCSLEPSAGFAETAEKLAVSCGRTSLAQHQATNLAQQLQHPANPDLVVHTSNKSLI